MARERSAGPGGGAPFAGRALWLVALVVGWCAAGPAFAQTGALEVLVTEAGTGEPLPGATVTLTHSLGYIPPASQVTGEDGRTLFPVLRAGAGYAIEVRLAGYATRRVTDLRLKGDGTLPLPVTLFEAFEERVEVRGGGRVVDLERVGASTTFDDTFIEALPQRGKLYQDLLALAPGVVDEDGDGNPNVHGARSRDFRAEVGGVSNVDPLTGHWLSYVNADSIESLEILPIGAGVEFGRAQGGFARVVQKQGSNRFEGVFGMLYRTSKLDRDGAGRFDGLPRADFDTLQPSVQLSGPLIRDRLWFRLSHEQLDREEPLNLLGRFAVTTTEQRVAAGQLTWQVSPRHRLAFQYQYDPLRVDNIGVSSAEPPETTATLDRGGPTYTVSWTAPASARVLFDSMVAWQDLTTELLPTEPSARQRCTGFRDIPALNTTRCHNLSTNQVSGPFRESSRDHRQRLTARSVVTFHRRLFGQGHRFKLGFVVENERFFRRLERTGAMTFETYERVFDEPFGVGSLALPVPRRIQSRATGNNWALFVEDQWKPRHDLSITLGLRVDREEIEAEGLAPFDPAAESRHFFDLDEAGDINPSSVRGIWTTHHDVHQLRRDTAAALDLEEERANLVAVLSQAGFWHRLRRPDTVVLNQQHLSPRLSFAWDPWRSGKTKLSVSAGRYRDKLVLAVPLVDLEPPEIRNDFSAVFCSGEQVFGICPPGVIGYFTRGSDVTVDVPLARLADRDLRTPYQDELALSFEREIFTETSIRAHYVRRRFEDQLQDFDLNHEPGDHGRCVFDTIDVGFGQILRPHRLVSSQGSGQTVFDPGSGETYIDTEPGPGDGRIDDCIGDTGFFFVPGVFGQIATYDIPDGRPDLYARNPAWDELLVLGNFNRAEYRAFVLEIVRRQYRGWQLEGSYTLSEARGDAEDFDLTLGNDQNFREDERGFLDYDQRHVVKLNAISLTPWGFRLGTTLRWESGLPYSILTSRRVSYVTPPRFPFGLESRRPRLGYPTGQRNDHRNPSTWTVDVRISREIDFGDGVLLHLSAEAFNLMNDDTIRLERELEGLAEGSRRFGRRWQLGARLNF